MPSLIQRFPSGLLSLLDIKGTGRAPADLSDTVVATLNLEPYYLAPQLTIAAPVAVSAGAAIVAVAATVPAGEVWRVVGVSAFANNLSAAVVRVGFHVTLAPAGAPGDCIICTQPIVSSVAATDRFGVGVMTEPLVVMPGSSITAVSDAVNGGATYDLGVRVLFHRLVG
jgi:hypothetical protein